MPKKAKEKGVRQSILFKKSLQPSVNLSSNKPEKKPRKKKKLTKNLLKLRGPKSENKPEKESENTVRNRNSKTGKLSILRARKV